MLFKRYISILTLLFIAVGNSLQLYNSNEVVVFNPESFKNIISNTSDYWFVQFYHSSCGHCRNFSPLFKKFLEEANYWSYAMKIGVLDCYHHTKFCRFLKIPGYPSFKVYSPNNGWEFVEPDRQSIITLFQSLIGYIKKYNIDFTINYFKPLDTEPVKPYMLIESRTQLDLERAYLTYSRRLSHTLYYKSNKNLPKPRVTIVDLNGNKSQNFVESDSVESLYRNLNQYLQSRKVATIKPDQTTIKSTSKLPYYLKSKSIPAVYSQDIYSSVWMALRDEVYNDKINDPKLAKIVVQFLDSLIKYSNLNKNIIKCFIQLKESIQSSINLPDRTTMDWKTLLLNSGLPQIKPSWIGCNSSLPNLRRYPCGLWTTFHTLTVNLYLKDRIKKLDDIHEGYKLMSSIRDFIINFFSCRECAVNFNRETIDFENHTQTPEDTMIYLWSVHNSVNQRLSKELLKDPEYPKIRFPPVQHCPNCWKQSSQVSKPVQTTLPWDSLTKVNKDTVISYLIKHYSNNNRIHMKFSLTQLGRLEPRNRSLILINNPQAQLGKQKDTSLIPFFSNMDLSLCLFVSIASSILVVVLFVKFLLNSRIIQNMCCPQFYPYQNCQLRSHNMV